MRTYTAAQIITIGGNEWRTATKHRIYLNNWQALAGLQIETYKSGNISSATLNGTHISNSKAAKLSCGKVFWENGTIHFQGVADELHTAITGNIAAALAPPAPTQSTTADTIAALRAAGRTARQIAAAVGVHVSTVYRWARGMFRPTTARATALAALAA